MVLTLSASANIKCNYPSCKDYAIAGSNYCIIHDAIVNDI